MTPAQYVEWAQRKARELNLSFDGTPERIEAMIREGRFADGDLFLDYDVKGNLLSRNGLNALINEALNDPRVTHVLIPRRDRLARPDDPLDGIKLENVSAGRGQDDRLHGSHAATSEKGQEGRYRGTHHGDWWTSTMRRKFRRDLAQKILYAQLRLAKLGFSTGGRPPYGFRRWLVKDDGTQVRELAEGERVRMAGHHVVWLPTAEAELKVIRRILEMLETMPASRVAAQLTAEGIPSPDAGRWRKDRGIKHPVSGVWHQTTVVNIARNKLLVAVASFGLRSMGDKLRFTPEGPRELEETDFREDEKPKVIRNPEEPSGSRRLPGSSRWWTSNGTSGCLPTWMPAAARSVASPVHTTRPRTLWAAGSSTWPAAGRCTARPTARRSATSAAITCSPTGQNVRTTPSMARPQPSSC